VGSVFRIDSRADSTATEPLGGIVLTGLDVLSDMGLDFARFGAAGWRFVNRHGAGVLCLCCVRFVGVTYY
jgi:hypothetical protein